MSGSKEIRTYVRSECAVFRKTAEAFGGLSNMAPGFPVRVNGVRILTVEALYQACRFPHRPEVQRKIVEQTSPMTAKMVGKPFRDDSRPDWDRVRVKIMRWVLRLKLAMHWSKFSELLLSTGDRPIVEDSRKDDFWGAIPTDSKTLVGMNVLGRLLMELREEIKQGAELRRVEPPAILDFLLFGAQLGAVDFRADKSTEYMMGVANTGYAVHESPMQLFADLPFESPVGHPSTDAPHGVTQKNGGMIEGLKPYAEYKESGQEWLGGIPAHWDLKPGHAAFAKRKEPNLGLKEKIVLSLSYGRIKVKATDKQHGLVPESYETYQVVNAGNIIIRGTDLQNDHTSLRIGLSRTRGIISSAYLCLEAQPTITTDYGYQILNVFDLTKAIYRYGSGLRQNLDHGEIKRLPIFLPPLDEQAAIVRFLDHANRKIDGFIRAKRKLIGLLNEQKQAIIHRAVTRGLDPDVPLKPSDIPWLGDIPKHWEVRPIKHWTKINERTLAEGTAANFEFRYIDIGAVRTGCLVAEPKVMRFDSAPSRARRVLIAGDTIISTVRTYLKAVWFVGDSPVNLVASTGFAVFSPLAALEPEYLSYVLQDSSFVNQVASNSVGIAYPAISEGVLARLRVAIPPSKSEQSEAIVAIKSQTEPLNTAIARTEREITLMQEYRKRLTADIVTGKLDVREAAAKLPDLPVDAATTPVADEMTEAIEMEESP